MSSGRVSLPLWEYPSFQRHFVWCQASCRWSTLWDRWSTKTVSLQHLDAFDRNVLELGSSETKTAAVKATASRVGANRKHTNPCRNSNSIMNGSLRWGGIGVIKIIKDLWQVFQSTVVGSYLWSVVCINREILHFCRRRYWPQRALLQPDAIHWAIPIFVSFRLQLLSARLQTQWLPRRPCGPRVRNLHPTHGN